LVEKLRGAGMTDKERKEREKQRLKIAYMENGLDARGLPLTNPTTGESDNVEEVERMQDGGKITASEIINRIEDVKESFELSNGVTNWRKESPSMFSAFCMQVGKQVFDNGKKNLLKVKQEQRDYVIPCPYDVDYLKALYEYYTYLCGVCDVPIRVYDFATFCGMKQQVIYDKGRELTSSVRDLFLKIGQDNESSLESVGIGGKRNSLVIMASLNHRHGWNKDTTQEITQEKAVTCQELPKLGLNTEKVGI
jgi:hypothetical protein